MLSQASSLSSSLVRERSESAREPSWLTEARLAAWRLYEKLPAAEWPRTPAGTFDPALAGPAAAATDARVARSAPATKGLIALDLATAAREHPDLVRAALGQAVNAEGGKWDALHAAAWNVGTLVHVEKGVEVVEPVVIDLAAGAAGALAHTLVVAEPLSKVSVVERLRSTHGAAPALVTSGVELLPKDGAKIHYAAVQDLALNVRHYAAKRAVTARDASVAWVDAQFGAAATRGTLESALVGQGSSAVTLSAFFGDGAQRFDVATSSLHRARSTSSQITAKGVLLDEAYAYYAGLVNIGHEAPGSSGHLTENTLLLSEKAHADAIPKLDVENNDVSASHGATVGQVDPDQLFYIKTRGVPEKVARRLIVEGFFEPLLKEIPTDAVRDELAGAIARRMS